MVQQELAVQAGGGEDLYGVFTDIDDEYTGMATVIPITNNFTGYLTFKKNGNTVNPSDKLHFNQDGELEKTTGVQKSVNAIALSKVQKLTEELYIGLVSVFRNRAVKGQLMMKGLNTDDNPQLDLESEVFTAATRAKRQVKQAKDEQAKDPSYLDSVKEIDNILVKFKKYAKSMSSI